MDRPHTKTRRGVSKNILLDILLLSWTVAETMSLLLFCYHVHWMFMGATVVIRHMLATCLRHSLVSWSPARPESLRGAQPAANATQQLLPAGESNHSMLFAALAALVDVGTGEVSPEMP